MLTGTPFDSRGCDTHMCAFYNADPLDFFTQQGRSILFWGELSIYKLLKRHVAIT